MQQRSEQYHDLLHSVEFLERVKIDAPREEILLHMWLLDSEEIEPQPFPDTHYPVSST